jgi:alkanesulfonate monooxygenase SsuD/methylene tetrahydromethanopterin reductase-like flavin-dependent oxidoreductase (luciferase family)
LEFCTAICARIDQVDLVARAEQVGVSHFGAGDGPLLFSDPFQFLALAARETSSIRLGTLVANPLTRTAPVTANSVATLGALAPGRTFVGLGTANNALRSMGQPPARVDDLHHGIEVIRGLLGAGRVPFEWRGRRTEVELLADSAYYDLSHDVPVWVAAGGPKVMELAARTADAMVYCMGPQPEFIPLVRRRLDDAVRAAGRPPGSVKLIALTWFHQLRAGETYEDAVVNGFELGPVSSCIVNLPFMEQHVDVLGRGIVEACRTAATAFLGDPSAPDAPHHLDVWRAYMMGMAPAQRSIVTKEIVDYWCLYGTPDELRAKTDVLLENGVDMVSVMLANPAAARQNIEDIGASILAAA